MTVENKPERKIYPRDKRLKLASLLSIALAIASCAEVDYRGIIRPDLELKDKTPASDSISKEINIEVINKESKRVTVFVAAHNLNIEENTLHGVQKLTIPPTGSKIVNFDRESLPDCFALMALWWRTKSGQSTLLRWATERADQTRTLANVTATGDVQATSGSSPVIICPTTYK